MSLDSFKAFSQKVLEDQELKKKAKETGINNIEGIIALAKENGFEISKDDFEAAAKEFESKEELSDEDLEQVAGGVVTASVALAAVSAAAAVTSCTAQGGW
jgi:predicted ribosomally synthesized peptide with nif11-like leader